MDAALLKDWLQGCPPADKIQPGPDDLSGSMVDGVAVCSTCAGRLIARGISMGREAVAVWDEPLACDLCQKEAE